MTDKNIQIRLLNLVKDVMPMNASFVEEVAELLGLSTDSIYRRYRGETELTVREAAILCNHFKISFDKLNELSEDTVSFSFKTIHSEEDFLLFFKRMLADLNTIQKRIDTETQITYASFDIPLFHHFKYTLLTEFKLYIWMSSVLNLPDYTDKIFKPEMISHEMLKVCSDSWNTYKSIPSREIWTVNTLNSTIKQIEFHWDSGKIGSIEIVNLLIDEFKDEITQIEKMASRSSKLDAELPTENFQLYISETEIGNNCIQATIGKEKAVYLSHNTFNTLTTFNSQFNAETDRWLDNLVKKSDIISGISQKRRYQFFKNAHNRIDALKEKLNQQP